MLPQLVRHTHHRLEDRQRPDVAWRIVNQGQGRQGQLSVRARLAARGSSRGKAGKIVCVHWRARSCSRAGRAAPLPPPRPASCRPLQQARHLLHARTHAPKQRGTPPSLWVLSRRLTREQVRVAHQAVCIQPLYQPPQAVAAHHLAVPLWIARVIAAKSAEGPIEE